MKWIAPVGIVTLILAVYLFLRDPETRDPQPPGDRTPTPEVQEIDWNEETPAGDNPTAEEGSAATPDVGGSVTDQFNRAQEGLTVEAVDPAGKILASCLTDPAGDFAMEVPAVPPYILRVRGSDDHHATITILPSLSETLLVRTPPQRKETLYIKPLWEHADDAKPMLLQLIDSQAQVHRAVNVALVDSPWRIEGVPFGTWDLRVWKHELCGLARRFEFDEVHRQVEIRLGRPAGIRGTPRPPARAMLIPSPPMGHALPRKLRETDGHRGYVRAGLMDTGMLVKQIDFSEVPAGEYTLVLISPNQETVRRTLRMNPGEVLDLGVLQLQPASGSVSFQLKDRDERTTEFGYVITIYARDGTVLEAKTKPGDPDNLTVARLSAGAWFYRVERRMDGGGRRSIKHDQSFMVQKGQTTRVEVDLTWRFE